MADTKLSDMTVLASAVVTDIIFGVDDPGGSPLDRKIALQTIRNYITPQLLYVREEQATTTAGGASSNTTTHTRVLNTVVVNEITGASLGSNQITLPAGTYRIRARAPGFDSNTTKGLLWNVTDGALEIAGVSMYSASAGQDVGFDVTVNGQFTIAAEKVFELRHYFTTGTATQGLGIATGDGGIEVYSEVWIQKVPA